MMFAGDGGYHELERMLCVVKLTVEFIYINRTAAMADAAIHRAVRTTEKRNMKMMANMYICTQYMSHVH